MTTEEVQIKYPKLWEAFLEECRKRNANLNATRILEGGSFNDFEYMVSAALFWDDSIYGRPLWSNINRHNYDEAERLYPQLFIQGKPKVGSIIRNGFFKINVL